MLQVNAFWQDVKQELTKVRALNAKKLPLAKEGQDVNE